jgi:cytoskeletal protein CcmA (bactofilin family)
MFSKKNKVKGSPLLNQKQTEPAKPAVPSILSRDLVMTGDLKSDGEIQVDGKIIGDIKTKSLLVGKTANVKGEIVAEDVRVQGTVDGQIKAHTVTLAKTAHVVGDILHVNLSIETGAFLEGLCKRMSDTELADDSKINIEKKEPEPEIAAHSSLIANSPKKF